MSEPTRCCIGCRSRRPASQLHRVVWLDDRLQEGRTLPGRGAWLCDDDACWTRGLRRALLCRVLRADIPDGAVAAFRASSVG